MDFDLTSNQQAARREFRDYVDDAVRPHAGEWDRAQCVPGEVIADLARRGYLGAGIDPKFGGRGFDQITTGMLTAEIARGCSSLRTLLTVHGALVAETLQRWGKDALKEAWLPRLAKGEKLAAFALSEAGSGSDAEAMATEYAVVDDGFELSGTKKWTSYGQIADVVLTFARGPKGVSAFLIETDSPGVEVRPIRGMLGTRASMLAEITFDHCRVPADHLLGRAGWGFRQIAHTALDNGRYSVACGCLGIIHAALEASIDYAGERQQFGRPIAQHQLVQRRLARMTATAQAVQLQCRQAGAAREAGEPMAVLLTNLAKYAAAAGAHQATDDALQIHGAAGCHEGTAIERWYRDARVMEIIEGSTEMQEIMIGSSATAAFHHLFEA